jgi:uncharacterized protein YjdB
LSPALLCETILTKENRVVSGSAVLVFCLSSGFLQAQPGLRITSPADGAVVSPGRSFTVKVAASGGRFEMVGLLSDLPIALDQVLASPPYDFTVAIPANVPQRSYMLTAVGVISRGQGAFSETISIDVRRTEPPAILRVEPSSLYLRVGAQGAVLVTGKFSDGSKADITQSAGTVYSSTAPGVAVVSADGRVTAVAPGSARILVNGNYSIPVTVPPLITIVPAARTLYAGQTLQLTAHVTMSDESVVWSMRPAGPGTLSSWGFYSAPAEVKSQQRITITATSVSDPTKSASATVTLSPRNR